TNVAAVIDTDPAVARMYLYVNGRLVASQATGGPMVADTVPLTIGSSDSGIFSFIGQIDEVQIYNRALTASQIAALSFSADIPATDQRGEGRVGAIDIGAFESQGFTLTAVAGSTPQTSDVGTPFANPLAVTVSANNALEPVDGGVVNFLA